MNNTAQSHIQVHQKSQLIGLLLTFLFGPFGLFYSSWLFSIVLIVIAMFVAITGTLNIVTIVVLCWPSAIILGAIAVDKYNKQSIAKVCQDASE